VYPGLSTATEWVPLNGKQVADFVGAISDLAPNSMQEVNPAVAQSLPAEARDSTVSVEVTLNGQATLVTLSTSAYFNGQTVAGEQDSRQSDMPTDCLGAPVRSMMGRALVFEYLSDAVKEKAQTGGPVYQRVLVYSSAGIRYAVSEVTGADGLIKPSSDAGTAGTVDPGTPATGTWVMSPLPVNELAELAFQVATTQ
jgi:hypothetical protein